MRVATESRVVLAEPGSTVEVVVDVVNTGDLIDGVTTRLHGIDATVRAEPAVLPLFPGATGQVTLGIDVPAGLAAGLHPLTVEVVSHVAGATGQHLDLDLSVSARPAVRLSRAPALVRAKRTGKFVLLVENTGNTALDVELSASTPDRGTTLGFTPARLTVEPGTSAPVLLSVRGPRLFTGGEAERQVNVALTARRSLTIPAMDALEAEGEPELTDQTGVTLRQRPLVSRGLLTALILAGIVLLWALVFLLGLTQVFTGDPMTKTAPASYFAASADAGGTPGAEGAGGAAAAPPGATPKTGLLAPGVGGTVSGTVTATSNGGPVGRILVQAYRMGREGPVLVSSAATQADGSYTLAGLFPTSYWLRLSAPGFRPVWTPGRPAAATAEPASLTGTDADGGTVGLSLAATTPGIRVVAQGEVEGVGAVVRGLPAQISGTVDPGDSLQPAVTTVTARMLDPGPDGPPPAVSATTDAAGRYVLPGLVAPGRYELTFTTPGYGVSTIVESVTGGEDRLEPTVLLSAQTGRLTGVVSGAAGPLGGVTVTTTVGGQAVSIITPTVGAVGAFDIGDLPTPGTYVVTFTAPGHGSATRIVDLAAGESGRADVRLTEGTGSVTGVLRGPDGKGLGGATVTVGGTSVDEGTTAPTTSTLTSGQVGAFTVSGLTAPGSYTLTFTLPGYRPETVPVELAADRAPAPVSAQLRTQLGRLSGTVTGPDGAFSGATVVVTNGVLTRSTLSTGPGGSLPSGGYLFAGLEPGVYSVTVRADGMRQQTGLVTITGGDTVSRPLTLDPAS